MNANLQEQADATDASLDAAIEKIRSRTQLVPAVAIILGTGLGGLGSKIQDTVSIPYSDIPGFPQSTALSHAGCLLIGNLEATPVVAMQGRFHMYEGYSIDEIVLPVHVMRALGATTLVVSNASGGVNPQMAGGDVLVMKDHINLMYRGNDTVKPTIRTGRTSEPIYSPHLISVALAAARRGGFHAQQGVYVGFTGPNYETRAEYRLVRKIGGDVVGMSTVPEAITANQLGMQVLGLSVVTNVARPDAPATVNAGEVVEVAGTAQSKMESIVRSVLQSLK
ncbi:MAG: purine-nucleoside phosphorylase [Pirellulaceae bacterium]